MSKSLFELIDALLSLPRLDRESVERVNGLSLISVGGQNLFFVTWKSLNKGLGDVAEIELRCPGPKSMMKDGMVILKLCPDLKVTTDDIHARFGAPEDVHVPPDGREGHPFSYCYSIRGAKLSFGFRESACKPRDILPVTLVDIVIDRTGC
jgi:hypothetical protein